MKSAPLPVDEANRIAALVGCGVLDTAPEAAFDDIAQLASQLCSTPIALVSLVDRSRQWFKAKVGLQVDETPRDVSFCAHAVLSHAPLLVPDALEDPRFVDNPLVTGDPFIRFYAGVPLVLDDGAAVGSLCVIDRVPRELTSAQLDALTMLARRASTELSLRRKLRDGESELPRSGVVSLPLVSAPTAPLPLLPKDRAERTRDPLPVPLGTRIADRYRIERVLGVGGMGVVTAAHDEREDRPVAIKFMHPNVLGQPQALERFVREAQVLLALGIDQVARVHDVGNLASGAPFIVMEYLEGSDLAERLAREGPLPPREVVELALQTCSAIEAAHAHGILHRDLKPANLFVIRDATGEPRIKVLDFGISKLASSDPTFGRTALTGAAASLGSPHYMSPEQMQSASAADARSDIWSLGVVLYELLSGRPPYEGDNVLEVCAKVLTSPLPPLQERAPELPPALVTVVQRCLQREPSERYQRVAELHEALARVRPQLS